MVFFIFVYDFSAKLRKIPHPHNTLKAFETIIKQNETAQKHHILGISLCFCREANKIEEAVPIVYSSCK